MTVQEFYTAIGGNYNDALQRLMNDALVYRFLMKFPADKSFEQLKTALENQDVEAAFSAAHTLKGVTLNLAFERLAQASVTLTDALRPEHRDGYAFDDFGAMFADVEKEYAAVCAALETTTVD